MKFVKFKEIPQKRPRKNLQKKFDRCKCGLYLPLT